MFKKQLIRQVRQFNARLRNDSLRLKQFIATDELNNLLLPPLWKIVIDYWSEDGRIVNLIADQPYSLITMVNDLDDKRIKIEIDLDHTDEFVEWRTHEKRAELMFLITIFRGIDDRVCWEIEDIFESILMLPKMDENGNSVPIDYPDLTLRGIVALRDVMYKSLH